MCHWSKCNLETLFIAISLYSNVYISLPAGYKPDESGRDLVLPMAAPPGPAVVPGTWQVPNEGLGNA